VELVLRLDHHFMEAGGVRPRFRFFGERPKMPLTPPIAPCAADPAVQDLAAVEPDAVLQARDQILQLRFRLERAQLVDHLVRDRYDRPRLVTERRFGHQDQELAMPEAVGDFVRRLFSRKLPEEFLDVLNLERAGIQGVLLDEVFHSLSVLAAGPVNYTASAAGRGTSLAVEAGE